MRHLKDGVKLGRTATHRKAMFRNMVTSLLKYERIETTLAKSKELRRIADRMITLGKEGTLSARRRAASYIQEPKVLQKLFDSMSSRYTDRNGGYTRTYKAGLRRGDASKMAIIELVDRDLGAAPKKRVKKAKEE
ncbi:MAG: 50S ribosomal protein L17 [Nitrospinota bacterium]|nr:50S ribosomal protein L17 [Nitrospinota bacterium]